MGSGNLDKQIESLNAELRRAFRSRRRSGKSEDVSAINMKLRELRARREARGAHAGDE